MVFITAKSDSKDTFLGNRKPAYTLSTGHEQNMIERDKRRLDIESE